jgi:hypothetical protein
MLLLYESNSFVVEFGHKWQTSKVDNFHSSTTKTKQQNIHQNKFQHKIHHFIHFPYHFNVCCVVLCWLKCFCENFISLFQLSSFKSFQINSFVFCQFHFVFCLFLIFVFCEKNKSFTNESKSQKLFSSLKKYEKVTLLQFISDVSLQNPNSYKKLMNFLSVEVWGRSCQFVC